MLLLLNILVLAKIVTGVSGVIADGVSGVIGKGVNGAIA